MLANVLKAIFGSRNDRLLKQYRKTVESINALEPAMEKLSDEALAAKTRELAELRARRMDLEMRARLLRDTSLSADLLEERARSLLGYSDPRDYVIRTQR